MIFMVSFALCQIIYINIFEAGRRSIRRLLPPGWMRSGDEREIGGLADLTRAIRADTPLATVKLWCELVPDRFLYRPGVTYVGSTVADLLQAGAGVCQDLVHLSLVLLRRHGIAARYVSGFLWAAPQEEGSDSLEVETHACSPLRCVPCRAGIA